MKLNIDVVGHVLDMYVCLCVCVWSMLRALIRAWGLLRLMATQLGLDVDANEADFGDVTEVGMRKRIRRASGK